MIKLCNLVILLCLLNGLLAINNNETAINIKNHQNLRNSVSGNSGLVFSSLSFTYLKKYGLCMCTGNVKFENVMDCATFAGSQMKCAFSSHPMSADHFKLYTNHVYTVQCPSTPVSILSDDSDAKYFNCLTDTVYSMDMSKKYSTDEGGDDPEVKIVGIVLGTTTIIVVAISIGCCCLVKKGGGKSIICNCQPPPQLAPTKGPDNKVIYSQPSSVPPVFPPPPPPLPSSSNKINNNNNDNNTLSTSTQPQCMPYIIAQQLPDGTVQYYSTQPAGPNQSVLYSNSQQNNGNLQPVYPIDPKVTPGCTYSNLPGVVNTSANNNNYQSDDEEYPSCKVVLPGSTLSRNPV